MSGLRLDESLAKGNQLFFECSQCQRILLKLALAQLFAVAVKVVDKLFEIFANKTERLDEIVFGNLVKLDLLVLRNS